MFDIPVFLLPAGISVILLVVAYFLGRVLIKTVAICWTILSLGITTYDVLSSEVFSLVLSLLSISPELGVGALFFSAMGMRFTFITVLAFIQGIMLWGVFRRSGA